MNAVVWYGMMFDGAVNFMGGEGRVGRVGWGRRAGIPYLTPAWKVSTGLYLHANPQYACVIAFDRPGSVPCARPAGGRAETRHNRRPHAGGRASEQGRGPRLLVSVDLCYDRPIIA